MNLNEFHADVRNQALTRAEVEGIYAAEAFVAEIAERLSDAEEVEHLTTLTFEGEGKRRRRLAIHGFDLDDSDDSIALAVLRFGGGETLETFNFTEANQSLKALLAFLEEAVGGEFVEGREESTLEYQVAEDLRKRGRAVSRYRLYLLSDMKMSDSAKGLASTELNGIPVDFHVWDIARLHQVSQSLVGREELTIDLTEWMPTGLPALEVTDSSNEFRTYLAAVPGDMVADLYGRYGSRLLEGNVRSYLSNRGKVNKGIRLTVTSEPAHFLAYNNGITATAVGVDLKDGNLARITDLQIVNGGQTTASLFYVKRENKGAELEDVFVQMKLVVVEAAKAADMVPRISRYANSQNRVSEADFFSNSPFHVRLAELSQRVLVPPQPGVNFQTKWFYERTRGLYQNEKNKRSTAEQRKFEAEYPRRQVIDKTAAAKYEVSWGMQPHMVSAGAQKNFMAFASLVAAKWDAADSAFNEMYWKQLVAKAILFESIRAAIAKADWYEKGYLANLVTYTMAKLAFEVGRQARGGAFDLERVWINQIPTEATLGEALQIGARVLAVLTSEHRPVSNVTEWAKKEACWDLVRQMPHDLSPELMTELADRKVVTEKKKAAAAVQKIDSGIAAQTRVVTMQASEWVAIEEFARSRKLASPTDLDILAYVTGRKNGFPTEAQAGRLLRLLAKCEEYGFETQ